MEAVKQRLAQVEAIGTRHVTTGEIVFDIELAFLHVRKILELIAFGSLIANRDKYSAVHENFANHWKAKDMLSAIEKLNADFYPVPVKSPQKLPSGVKKI